MVNYTFTEGYIDSASVQEVVAVFNFKRLKDAYNWACNTALEVTCILFNATHLKVAPGPSFYRAPSGLYGHLLQSLSDIVIAEHVNYLSPETHQKALRNTKRWATRNHKKVVRVYKQLESDKVNFQRWLDRSITDAWVGHAKMLGGLFDKTLIPQISRVLDIPESDLYDIFQLSCDLDVVESYVKRRPDNDVFKIMQQAFTIAALLRGRYHDYVAKELPLQIMHHPIRAKPVLLNLQGKPKTEFMVSNTEQYLSMIILGGAFAEKTRENRISCWAENVRKVRNAVFNQAIDLRPKSYDEVAENHAVEIAQRLNIRTYPQFIEQAFDVAVAMSVGILTSFVLTGWESLTTSSVTYLVSDRKKFGKRVASLSGTQNRLHDLAKFNPGRVESAWEKNKVKTLEKEHSN